jgi:small conductance mechanosensitive channel
LSLFILSIQISSRPSQSLQTSLFAVWAAIVLAGLDLAVGTMLGGMLANLASRVVPGFPAFLPGRRFHRSRGSMGTATKWAALGTTMDTPDNIRTYVGNNKIFSGNIQNFTVNPFRRVDLKAQLNQGVDAGEAGEKNQKELCHEG